MDCTSKCQKIEFLKKILAWFFEQNQAWWCHCYHKDMTSSFQVFGEKSPWVSIIFLDGEFLNKGSGSSSALVREEWKTLLSGDNLNVIAWTKNENNKFERFKPRSPPKSNTICTIQVKRTVVPTTSLDSAWMMALSYTLPPTAPVCHHAPVWIHLKSTVVTLDGTQSFLPLR